MKSRRIVLLGGIAYVIAWLLPVIKGGFVLPEGLPGWQAFRVAAEPVWPYGGSGGDPFWSEALSTASAATNFVMITLLVMISRATQPRARIGANAAFVCFLVNAQWVIREGRGDLRAGYYVWWLSFLIVGYALLRSDADSPSPASAPAA